MKKTYYSDFYPYSNESGVVGTTMPALTEARVAEIIGDIGVITDDSVLTVDEKIRILIPLHDEVELEYENISAQAIAFGINIVQLEDARTAWIAYLNSLSPAWDDKSQNTNIDRGIFRQKINNYLEHLYIIQANNNAEAARRADVDGGLTDGGTPITRTEVITSEGTSRDTANVGGIPAAQIKSELQTALDRAQQAIDTFDTVAPAVPSGLALSNLITTIDSITGAPNSASKAEWSAVTDSDLMYYEVEITSALESVPLLRTANINQLVFGTVAGTNYTVKVRAVDDSGNRSDWSASQSIIGAKDQIAPTTPSGLTAEALVSSVILKWTNSSSSDLKLVKLYENPNNDFASATLINSFNSKPGSVGSYTRNGLPVNATRYYWIVSEDTSGNSSGPSNVASATAKGVDIVDFTPGLYPTKVVSSLPGAPHIEGTYVYLTTDKKTYRNTGTGWVKNVDTADLSGSISDVQIDGLSSAKLIGQLTNEQLQAIDAAKVAGQLTNEQIANLNAAKIAGQLTNEQIQSIDAAKAVGNLINAQLAANKVTGQLVNEQIEAIDAAKAVGNLINAQLAANKVTGQLTSDQIQSLSAAKIAGEITSTQISDSSISTPKIAAGAIVASKIAANSIVASKLLITPGSINPDVGYFDDTLWGWNGDYNGWYKESANVANFVGNYYVIWSGRTTRSDEIYKSSNLIPGVAKPGTNLAVRVPVRNQSNRLVLVGIEFFGATNNFLGAIRVASDPQTGFQNLYAEGVVPLDTVSCTFVMYSPAGAALDGVAVVGGISVTEMMTGQLIVDGSITANEIAAETITGDKISGSTITGANIVGGTITGGHIAGNTISAANIAGATITGDKISGNTITGANIVGGTITGGHIAARTVSAANIVASSITGAEILGDTITGVHIKGSTITGANIVGGTITGGHIAGNTITAANLTAGIITAGYIASRAITVDKLAVGSTDNLLTNGQFQSEAYGDLPLAWSRFSKPNNADIIRVVIGDDSWPVKKVLELGRQVAGTGELSAYADSIAIDDPNYWEKGNLLAQPGDEFYVESHVFSSNPNIARIEILGKQSSGAIVNSFSLEDFAYSSVNQNTVNINTPGWLKSVWTFKYNGIVPAKIGLRFWNLGGTVGQFVLFGNIIMRRRNTGTLLVDGAITANKIAANSITADKIVSGTISTGLLAAGAVTATKLSISGANINPDMGYMDDDFWNWTGDYTNWYPQPPGGQFKSKFYTLWEGMFTGTQDRHKASKRLAPGAVKPGSTVAVRVPVENNSGRSMVAGLEFYDINGTYISGCVVTSGANSGFNNLFASGVVPANTYNTGLVMYASSGPAFTGSIAVGAISVVEMTTGQLIVDGSITASEIAAATITGDKIVGGTITGGLIAANQIRTGHLLVQAFGSNANPDPYFADIGSPTSFWDTVYAGGWYQEANTENMNAINAPRGIVLWEGNGPPGTDVKYVHTDIRPIGATSGQKIRLRVKANNASNQIVWAQVEFFNSAKNVSGTEQVTFNAGSGISTQEGQFSIPSWATHWRFLVRNQGGSTFTGAVILSDFQVEKAVDANMIVDGSITASKILVGSISADRLEAKSITSAQIASNTITARTLAIGNFDNIIPDGDYRDAAFWKNDVDVPQFPNVTESNGAWTGGRFLQFVGSGHRDTYSRYFPIEIGATYKVTYRLYTGDMTPGGWFQPLIHVPNYQWQSILKSGPAGENVGANSIGDVANNDGSYYGSGGDTGDQSYVFHNPAGVTGFANKRIQFRFVGNFTGAVYMEIKIVRISDSTLITDGGITTPKLATGSVIADKISVSSLSAISANLGSITGGSLNINNKFIVDASGNLTIQSAPSGPRLVQTNQLISIYDANILRLRMGIW